MKFIHLRPFERAYINKKGLKQTDFGHGAISIAYVTSANHALVGMAFCSPKERMFSRKKAVAIAGSRLKTNPLHIRVDSEGIIASKLPLLVNTVFLDRPKWKISGDMSDGRFSCRWHSQIIGPDGMLVDLCIDGNTVTHDGIFMKPNVHPRTWMDRIPAWASGFISEMY